VYSKYTVTCFAAYGTYAAKLVFSRGPKPSQLDGTRSIPSFLLRNHRFIQWFYDTCSRCRAPISGTAFDLFIQQ